MWSIFVKRVIDLEWVLKDRLYLAAVLRSLGARHLCDVLAVVQDLAGRWAQRYP